MNTQSSAVKDGKTILANDLNEQPILHDEYAIINREFKKSLNKYRALFFDNVINLTFVEKAKYSRPWNRWFDANSVFDSFAL